MKSPNEYIEHEGLKEVFNLLYNKIMSAQQEISLLGQQYIPLEKITNAPEEEGFGSIPKLKSITFNNNRILKKIYELNEQVEKLLFLKATLNEKNVTVIQHIVQSNEFQYLSIAVLKRNFELQKRA